MSMDAVHFKTMLDKSRTTTQEQEEELRRRQATIADLECKVIKNVVFVNFPFVEIELKNVSLSLFLLHQTGVSDGC